VTIQNQNIPKVRIERPLNPVAMLLTLAAVVLLIFVAVMLIPVVAMSILAAVNSSLFCLKEPGCVYSRFFI